MPDKLLELSQVGKSFGPNRVLEGVCFELLRGEIHVLAGENGAGKSTLIKILAGIHTEYDGVITLMGQPRRFSSPADANRHGISVIHQELSLVDSMSIADNIHLGREPTDRSGWWLDRSRGQERALALCRELNLDFSSQDLEKPLERFSMSVKNRVEIAKALAVDARIIIMDEPTSALNAAEAEKLFAVLDILKGRGCGIIYISHKMEEIYRVGDRITVLRDGRCVGTAPTAKCSQLHLIRLMLGRDLANQIPARSLPPTSRAMPPRFVVDRWSLNNAEPGRPPLIKEFSLVLRPGEIVGLAGLQGSGASELLQSFFGAYPEKGVGNISIDGEDYVPLDPQYAIKRGLAYLNPDRKNGGIVPDMNVEKNITLAALQRISPGGFLRPAIEHSQALNRINELGIRVSSSDQSVRTLSGGNQQKVILAKWAETSPDIFLLDEPTRGVDVGSKHDIYHLINRWSAAGAAVVVLSTELPELMGLCDRILVLYLGSVVAEFDRVDADAHKILAAAMGAGPNRTISDPGLDS